MKYLFLFLFSLGAFADTLYKCGISNMINGEGYFILTSEACDAWYNSQKFNHSCIGGGCIQFKETPTQQELDVWAEVTEVKD